MSKFYFLMIRPEKLGGGCWVTSSRFSTDELFVFRSFNACEHKQRHVLVAIANRINRQIKDKRYSA